MINKVHERSLRVIVGDDLGDFESLLQNNDICSYYRNIQSLMVEMFKIKNELALPITDSIFESRSESYNLCNFQDLFTKGKRTVHYGLETLIYRTPQLWSFLPENVKEVESLEIFKKESKKLGLWRLSMQIM